ncbi:MAG: DUF177 domain-containing protein [Alphaproteobacteria bacterium]
MIEKTAKAEAMPNIIPEFSYPFEVDKIPPGGKDLTITATPEECQAVAERLRLLSLKKLLANLQLRRIDDSAMIMVTGNFASDVVQQCVVTLDPVPANPAGEISGLFAPPSIIKKEDEEDGEDMIDIMADEVEPIVGGIIDLGELVVQHLALALDPYPRSPGAKLTEPPPASNQNQRISPFAKLADLVKDKEKDKDK